MVERGGEQGMAVRRRIEHGRGADARAAARPILDHDRRAELVLQHLSGKPAHGVVRGARRKRHDDFDRLTARPLCLGERGGGE